MSWPPTQIDWGELTARLPDGAPVCQVHGLVDAVQAPIGIPICPHCGQAVLVTRRDRRGVLQPFVAPAPARCGRGHPLIGGRMTVGWLPCRCPATDPGPGGHRAWWCADCQAAGLDQVAARVCWPPTETSCNRTAS